MSKSPVIPSAKRREALEMARVSERYSTGRTFIRMMGLVGGVYYGNDAILVLAGQTTKIALELSLLADLKFVISIALAGLAGLWAILERSLRQRKVEQLQGRIRELEARLDSNRSSSGLTPKGQTHPRDKVR